MEAVAAVTASDCTLGRRSFNTSSCTTPHPPPPTPRADSPDCHLASAANYCTLFLKILYYYSYLYYYYWYYRYCQWVHWAWPLLFKSILKTYFLSVVMQGLRSEVTSICKVNSYNLFSYNSIFVALTLTDNWLFELFSLTYFTPSHVKLLLLSIVHHLMSV